MIENILKYLNAVKRSGKGYQARCPGHDDNGPSLSLREADDGRVLLHCHAGCSTNAVMAALGLTMTDLFPQSTTPRRPPIAPGVSRRELHAATERERDILYFLKCDMHKGKPISRIDLLRGQIAQKRLALVKGVL